MTYGFIKNINRTACGGTFKKRGCSKIDCGTVSALTNNSRRTTVYDTGPVVILRVWD